MTVVGRGRLDAALWTPPAKPRPGQMGRPRVRGRRLASPATRAARPQAAWRKVLVHVYGKDVVVRVLVIDALWYIAGGSEVLRTVVVRDFPGHDHDDVFVCTDAGMPARDIIETFARRWSLEVTFHEAKGKLGFEDPQNRTERAVERTAPMALLAHTLVVLWYALSGHRCRAARLPTMPWYTEKAGITFSDMLATLRTASWSERLLDPRANAAVLRKSLKPLIEFVSAAA